MSNPQSDTGDSGSLDTDIKPGEPGQELTPKLREVQDEVVQKLRQLEQEQRQLEQELKQHEQETGEQGQELTPKLREVQDEQPMHRLQELRPQNQERDKVVQELRQWQELFEEMDERDQKRRQRDQEQRQREQELSEHMKKKDEGEQVLRRLMKKKDIVQAQIEDISEHGWIDQLTSGICHDAWTEEEKKLVTEMSSLQVVFMGEQCAGKTSLAQTLLSKQSYLTKEEDRTVIADHFLWVPDKNKKMCISFVDIGGHRSYKITGHYFYSNARNNVAVLCHDLSSTEYTKSFDWVKMALQRSPKSSILFLLTKQDEAKDKEAGQMKLRFIEEFTNLIKKEIQALRNSLILVRQKKHKESKKKMLENQIQKYLDLEMSLQNQDYLHVTSCKVGYEHTITLLEQKLIKVAEDPKYSILLPLPLQLLYAKFGMKGVQIFKQGSDVKSSNNHCSKNMKVVGFDPYMLKYLKIGDILPVYKEILLSLNLSTDDIEVKLKHGLTLLHQHGLLIYFEAGRELQNIIFHDINSFVALLKVIFHHKNEKYLRSREDDHLFRQLLIELYGCKSNKFQKEVNQLYEQGLMTLDLLQFLLKVNDVSLDYEVVKELLLRLDEAALPFNDVNSMLFIPFFVKEDHICNELIEQTKHPNKDTLVVCCDIQGESIPKTFWHYILVKVFKLLPTKLQSTKVWKNAIWAKRGNNEGIILFQYGEDGIEFYIKGRIDSLEGHRQIWEFIENIMTEVDCLLCHWWPGLVVNKQMKCTHCTINGNKNPEVFDIDEDILYNEEQLETFDCGEDFPIALIKPLTKDTEKAAQKLKAAREYLNSTLENQIQPPAFNKRKAEPVILEDKSVRKRLKGNYGLHCTEADHKLTREETLFVTENLSKSVCFVRYHGKTGTGFLLGGIDRNHVKHWYLLTCFHLQLHVAFANGKPCVADFDGNLHVNILPRVLYCNENLDYTLVELATDVNVDTHMMNGRPLGELTTRSDPASNSALVIITNETQEKKIDFGARSVSLENADLGSLDEVNMIRKRTFHPQKVYPLDNNFTYYQCMCGLGTSGSPVLSAQNQLLYAMHCGSIDKGGSYLEYGVLLKHVYEDILQRIKLCRSTGAPSHLTETELQSLFPHLPHSMAIG